jgi:hypothetical protein
MRQISNQIKQIISIIGSLLSVMLIISGLYTPAANAQEGTFVQVNLPSPQANNTQLIRITAVPIHGTLRYNQVEVKDNQLIEYATFSGDLQYLPNSGFQGGDRFKYQILTADQILSEQSYDFDIKPTSQSSTRVAANVPTQPTVGTFANGEFEAPFSSDFTYQFDDNWGNGSYQGYQSYQGGGSNSSYQGGGGDANSSSNNLPTTPANTEPNQNPTATGQGGDVTVQDSIGDPSNPVDPADSDPADPADQTDPSDPVDPSSRPIGGGGDLIRTGGLWLNTQLFSPLLLLLSGVTLRKLNS